MEELQEWLKDPDVFTGVALAKKHNLVPSRKRDRVLHLNNSWSLGVLREAIELHIRMSGAMPAKKAVPRQVIPETLSELKERANYLHRKDEEAFALLKAAKSQEERAQLATSVDAYREELQNIYDALDLHKKTGDLPKDYRQTEDSMEELKHELQKAERNLRRWQRKLKDGHESGEEKVEEYNTLVESLKNKLDVQT